MEFDIKQRKEILKGKKAKLFYSWQDLIKISNLRNSFYKNLYGFKSNYSHSEFISILQVHEGQYGHNVRNTRSHHTLFLLNTLIAKMTIELATFFPTIITHFENIEDSKKIEILYLNEMATNYEIERKPN